MRTYIFQVEEIIYTILAENFSEARSELRRRLELA